MGWNVGQYFNSPYGEVNYRENFTGIIANALKQIPEKKFLKSIGPDIFTSIRRNFDVGGRPDAWPPSKRVAGTVWSKRKKMAKPLTLVLTGWLKASIQPDLRYGEDLVFSVGADYGIFHEQPPGWPSRKGLPQRRFLIIQDEDREKAAIKAQAWLDQLLS